MLLRRPTSIPEISLVSAIQALPTDPRDLKTAT
jgi:hypothetical protein